MIDTYLLWASSILNKSQTFAKSSMQVLEIFTFTFTLETMLTTNYIKLTPTPTRQHHRHEGAIDHLTLFSLSCMFGNNIYDTSVTCVRNDAKVSCAQVHVLHNTILTQHANV